MDKKCHTQDLVNRCLNRLHIHSQCIKDHVVHSSDGPAQNRHLHRENHVQVTHILLNTTLEDAEALCVYHKVYISGVALFVAAHLHEYKGRGGLARNHTA